MPPKVSTSEIKNQDVVPTSGFLSTQEQIDMLKRDLKALNDEVYRNNFSAHQDFNKTSNFTTRLKVPHYASLPPTCNIGELVEVSGKLYIGSSINVWTLVGSQT